MQRDSERVADAVERRSVPKRHARRGATQAMAGPVRWAPDVSERLAASEASTGMLAAEAQYLADLATSTIGDHNLAARFLGCRAGQVPARSRRAGRTLIRVCK
jgi:hypothetical protein